METSSTKREADLDHATGQVQQLSLKELKAYVLADWSDDQALHYYVDRMRNDPEVLELLVESYEIHGDRQFSPQTDAWIEAEWLQEKASGSANRFNSTTIE